MVRLAMITRLADSLPLCSSFDLGRNQEVVSEYQKQAKLILKRIPNPLNPLPVKASISSGPFIFHYIVEIGVCFMVLCESSYPRILAFSFLKEISKEFLEAHTHDDIQSQVRPYGFLSFEGNLQKAKKRYSDLRSLKTPFNLQDLSAEVQHIKVYSVETLLGKEYSAPALKDLKPSMGFRGNSSIIENRLSFQVAVISLCIFFNCLLKDIFIHLQPSFDPVKTLDEVSIIEHVPKYIIYLEDIYQYFAAFMLLQSYAFFTSRSWGRPLLLFSCFFFALYMMLVLYFWISGSLWVHNGELVLWGLVHLSFIVIFARHYSRTGPSELNHHSD